MNPRIMAPISECGFRIATPQSGMSVQLPPTTAAPGSRFKSPDPAGLQWG